MAGDSLAAVDVELSAYFLERERPEIRAEQRIGVILQERVLAAAVRIGKGVYASDTGVGHA